MGKPNGHAAAAHADPLIAALIAKLPAPGSEYSRGEREAWLRMMVAAFDLAYGPVGELAGIPALALMREAVGTPAANGQPANGQPAAPAPVRQAHAGHDFYVARDATVCNAEGVPVLLEDVPPDQMIFDYRPVPAGEFRDLDALVWADGRRGTAGMAAGASFCGRG